MDENNQLLNSNSLSNEIDQSTLANESLAQSNEVNNNRANSSQDLNSSNQLENDFDRQILESINEQNNETIELNNPLVQNEQVDIENNQNLNDQQEDISPIRNRANMILRYFNNLLNQINQDRENNNDENNNDENDDDDDDDDRDEENEDDEVDENDYDDDLIEFDEIDDDDDENDTNQMDENEQAEINDDYDNANIPAVITYDTTLPSFHNYLGSNFEEVSAPKTIHEQNDTITIPLLQFPGNEHSLWHNTRPGNDIQLLPGQIMPLFFYAPLQIQVIKKRMRSPDPTIGFLLNSKLLNEQQQQLNDHNKKSDDIELGILAEIISARDESTSEDETSMMHGTNGLLIKVKGRERFRVLKIRREITGCIMADVKILSDIVMSKNPLFNSCPKNTNYFYECYLHKNDTNNQKENKLICSQTKAEFLNNFQPFPAWLYRKYDCDYIISLIIKELTETFRQKISIKQREIEVELSNNSSNGNKEIEAVIDKKDPLFFSNWLLNNFPFDDKMRIECLKLNCVNQRLMYQHSLVKSFTNINCRNCGIQLCSKSDVFSISNQGFMSPYLNPGGFVHETLTVYKLKNFRLMRAPPSTQHTWFPGYGWQICNCKCLTHIGWKYTSTNNDLKPEKFFGLTRKSICHTFNKEESDDTEQQITTSISNENQLSIGDSNQ